MHETANKMFNIVFCSSGVEAKVFENHCLKMRKSTIASRLIIPSIIDQDQDLTGKEILPYFRCIQIARRRTTTRRFTRRMTFHSLNHGKLAAPKCIEKAILAFISFSSLLQIAR